MASGLAATLADLKLGETRVRCKRDGCAVEFPKSAASRAPEVARALAAVGFRLAGKVVYGSEKFGTELRLRRAKSR